MGPFDGPGRTTEAKVTKAVYDIEVAVSDTGKSIALKISTLEADPEVLMLNSRLIQQVMDKITELTDGRG